MFSELWSGCLFIQADELGNYSLRLQLAILMPRPEFSGEPGQHKGRCCSGSLHPQFIRSHDIEYIIYINTGPQRAKVHTNARTVSSLRNDKNSKMHLRYFGEEWCILICHKNRSSSVHLHYKAYHLFGTIHELTPRTMVTIFAPVILVVLGSHNGVSPI